MSRHRLESPRQFASRIFAFCRHYLPPAALGSVTGAPLGAQRDDHHRSDGLLLFASFTEVAQVTGQDVRATRLRFSLDSKKQ
jgi:hypothetical protein